MAQEDLVHWVLLNGDSLIFGVAENEFTQEFDTTKTGENSLYRPRDIASVAIKDHDDVEFAFVATDIDGGDLGGPMDVCTGIPDKHDIGTNHGSTNSAGVEVRANDGEVYACVRGWSTGNMYRSATAVSITAGTKYWVTLSFTSTGVTATVYSDASRSTEVGSVTRSFVGTPLAGGLAQITHYGSRHVEDAAHGLSQSIKVSDVDLGLEPLNCFPIGIDFTEEFEGLPDPSKWLLESRGANSNWANQHWGAGGRSLRSKQYLNTGDLMYSVWQVEGDFQIDVGIDSVWFDSYNWMKMGMFEDGEDITRLSAAQDVNDVSPMIDGFNCSYEARDSGQLDFRTYFVNTNALQGSSGNSGLDWSRNAFSATAKTQGVIVRFERTGDTCKIRIYGVNYDGDGWLTIKEQSGMGAGPMHMFFNHGGNSGGPTYYFNSIVGNTGTYRGSSTNPYLINASVNAAGNVLTLGFSEAIQGSLDGLVLTAGGHHVSIQNGEIDGAVVTFDIQGDVFAGHSIGVSYDGTGIEDADADKLQPFDAKYGLNNSTVPWGGDITDADYDFEELSLDPDLWVEDPDNHSKYSFVFPTTDVRMATTATDVDADPDPRVAGFRSKFLLDGDFDARMYFTLNSGSNQHFLYMFAAPLWVTLAKISEWLYTESYVPADGVGALFSGVRNSSVAYRYSSVANGYERDTDQNGNSDFSLMGRIRRSGGLYTVDYSDSLSPLSWVENNAYVVINGPGVEGPMRLWFVWSDIAAAASAGFHPLILYRTAAGILDLPDRLSPSPQVVTVDPTGTILTIWFNENMYGTPDGFTLKVNGKDREITGGVLTYSTVTYTITDPVENGDSVKLAYAISPPDMFDRASPMNALAPFTGRSVLNYSSIGGSKRFGVRMPLALGPTGQMRKRS